MPVIDTDAGRGSAGRTWRPGVAIGLFWLAISAPVPAADGPRQVLQAGPFQVVVEPWGRGVSIAVDGMAVSSGSSMVITKPPWTPHYYLGPSGAAVESAQREEIEGGVRLKMTHRGESGQFEGEDTITVTSGGRVERVLEGRFTAEEGEALIEWKAAGLNPVLIVGRPYRARLANGEMKSGLVPVTAPSADRQECTLAAGFEWIEFDSRIGLIRVQVEGPGQWTCHDYRKSRWADPARPLFWLGDGGTRFDKGKPLHRRIVFELPAPPTGDVSGEPARTEASITLRTDAQTYPVEEKPTIIPRPKEAEFGSGQFVLAAAGASAAIAVRSGRGEQADQDLAALAVAEWRRFLKERFGLDCPDGALGSGVAGVRLELPSAESAGLPPEGYALTVAVDGVALRAGDQAGFLHGVQTLKQLVTVRPSGEIVVRQATIRDWPTLKFRGVHMFTGGRGPDLHIRLLRNVLAALKMNHLVLECEYIKWDSHPEIHHSDYGMPKEEVRQILAVARELGIEVVPLVMSLGHCQWMFTNGKNLDLAEDPEAKWAYCVTNPKTYEFIFEVYAEALELFKPKWFHIGHDEFHHRGRVPFRESSKEYTVEQLFQMDTRRHYEWLGERGVRMMMWSDMLLGPGEGPDACSAASPESAVRLRDELPKDVIIADWHYVETDPDRYVDLDLFGRGGFTTVAATWSRPANITQFARAAFDKKALGLLQTTWAGYSLDPKSFEQALPQYAAYVLAADAAWNADNPPDPASYPAGAYFLELMGLSTLSPANRGGWTADLRGAYNYPLAAADAAGWFALGPEHDLSMVPSGSVRWNGLAFQLGNAAEPGHPSVVALRSRLTQDASLPAAVEITVGAPAAHLVILNATNFACSAGTKVAEYELTYADGEKTKTDVRYGQQVLAYGDLSPAAEAPMVWSGRNRAGEPVAWRVFIWRNPHPEKVIRTLTARSANAPGALLILGLTGLDATRAGK